MPKRESVAFNFDQPVKVALAYPDGKFYDFGSYTRVMFSLVDGRVMWVPPEWGTKIQVAQVQPGQEFWLVKRRKGRVDLYLEDPTPHQEESDLERDMRLSINQAQQKRQANGNTPPAPPTAPRPAPLARPPAEIPNTPQPIRAIARAPEPQQLPWHDFMVEQANCLTDVYFAVLSHARTNYGHDTLTPELVEKLVVTTYIQHTKGGRG